MDATIRLEESWKAVLGGEFRHGYMAELKRFLLEEKQQGRQIFRGASNISVRSI